MPRLIEPIGPRRLNLSKLSFQNLGKPSFGVLSFWLRVVLSIVRGQKI